MAEPETCLGVNMDCGRPLPCPDHPPYVGPHGVANWRAPLTEFERRAGVVDPQARPGPDRCPHCGEPLYSPAETEAHNRQMHNVGPVATTSWGAEP